MRLWTLSKADLVSRCAFSLSEHAPKPPPYVESAAAAHGNGVHLLSERIGRGHENPTEGLPETVTAYEQTLRDMLAALPDGERHYELPMAWDCERRVARILPSRGQRDYRAKKPTEVVGTADIVCVDSGWVGVYDTKTGVGARQKSARDSGQLRGLALCAARIFGAERATVGLCHVEAGEFYIDDAELDCFDLCDVEDEIDRVYQEVSAGNLTPKPGAHCYSEWCAISSSCPATQATLAVIDQEAHRHLPIVPVIETPEQAARVRVGLKLIDEKAKAWKEALQEYVLRNGAVEVGDGVYFGAVEKERETIDLGHEHLELLVSAMGHDAARSAVELRTSKSAIETACKMKQARRGEGVKVARAVFDELRARGAMRTSRFTTFSDFKRDNNNDNEAA